MDNVNNNEQPILNGRFKLITEDNEFRMSLWVRGFGINDANASVVLPMMSTFDLDGFQETGDTLKVRFKIYPDGSRQYHVEIDPVNRTFVYEGKTVALERFAETFKV